MGGRSRAALTLAARGAAILADAAERSGVPFEEAKPHWRAAVEIGVQRAFRTDTCLDTLNLAIELISGRSPEALREHVLTVLAETHPDVPREQREEAVEDALEVIRESAA
jgi:hypothetical protein